MQETEQIYGIRAVIEAIEAEKSIDKIFLQKGLRGPLYKQLEGLARKHSLKLSYVPKERIDRFTKLNHQGVVATISPISLRDLESLVEEVCNSQDNPLFLLLDQVTDVRNLGAIIRTASCTGVHGIILPQTGSAPITADTIKTSAGGVFQVPIAKTTHLKDAMFLLQGHGIKVIAATEKAEDSVYDTPMSKGVAIVMGAEGKGISPSILKAADYRAKLPMQGSIASLNVSVACGVFLYEAVRQRIV